MTRSNTQSARISDEGAGASGKAENVKAAALAAAETGSPCPAHVPAGLPRGRSGWPGQVERGRRVVDPAGVEAGRAAGEIAPQRQELRRGPERVADGEAQVAQRAFVGVEAQDLGGGGGALKRQAGAQRSGGRRVGAQEGVEKRESGAGGEQRIALPCPSARPRPGWDRPAAERLAAPGVFAALVLARARLAGGAETRSSGSGGRSASRVEFGANHVGMVNRWRRFVTCFAGTIRPACRGVGMSDKIALSDMIRNGPGRHAKSQEIRP